MNDGFSWIAQAPEFVVVNKMPGCDFHSSPAQPGLVVQVSEALGQRLWPVHRLDKMTSGLVLLARSEAAARIFGELFAARTMEKFYLAIGVGKPKKKQGLVAGDMVRSRRSCWKLSPSVNNPAITQFFSQGLGEKQRLYLLKPHTGKTHQLRVALKSLGVAIVGDPLYGGAMEGDAALARGHLHAYQMGFYAFDQHWQFSAQPSGGLFDREATQQLLRDHFHAPAALPWPALPASLVQ
ncbi:pseudouridine synthase [Simiduia aestuariiviva]|uniref:tRNA pseudouridine32 synthase/23S rRNA pseudouridine746 synthase n=1 Tax=Simiduia aestuariiviva TaxID=1510459 RepID=A0A839UQ57_9GAMM|nr:tRNA pseudouridine32 synthase/23S rRNA pseudouridine746 synthase [Simiduia aestuariiviva]